MYARAHRYVVLRARDIKMTSSKKSESCAKTFAIATICGLLCSPFAIEGTSATENNRRSPYGVAHSSSSTSDDARLLEVPPHPPSVKKGEEQQTALGSGNKKPTLTAKDVESYSSSGAWLERATEIERSKAPHSGEKEEGAKLRSSSAASTSSSHNDWDWIAERYAHVHKLYTGKKKHEAKVEEKKLQEQLEKEEEETKKKFFVGKPKLVDGRYHVSKSRSKGSFAYEHGKKDKNRQSAIVAATREGNKHGLHHHNWQQKHHKGFIESLEGAHKGGYTPLDTSGLGEEMNNWMRNHLQTATPAELGGNLTKFFMDHPGYGEDEHESDGFADEADEEMGSLGGCGGTSCGSWHDDGGCSKSCDSGVKKQKITCKKRWWS